MCAVDIKTDAHGRNIAYCVHTGNRIVMQNEFGYFCPNKCGLDEAKLIYSLSGQSPDWVAPKKQQSRQQNMRKSGSTFDRFMAEYREFIASAYAEIKGSGGL
jgi:hypothetical protein